MLNRDQQIVGAKACMNALRMIEGICATTMSGDLTDDEYYDSIEASVIALENSAGAQSAFHVGFIATLAEYLHMVNTCGVPNLDRWLPEAGMTEDEIKSSRLERAQS